jgi:hypothetical protein
VPLSKKPSYEVLGVEYGTNVVDIFLTPKGFNPHLES